MIIADSSEVQALRAELRQIKQVVKGMTELVAWWGEDNKKNGES